MGDGFDALAVVRDAVAVVCEVEPDRLTGETSFDDLDADSLARVSIADVVEDRLRQDLSVRLRLDDSVLARMTTLQELADDIRAGVQQPPPVPAAAAR